MPTQDGTSLVSRVGCERDHDTCASLAEAAHYHPFVLTRGELEAALKVGYESRSLELKGTGNSTDKHFLAKVARAALSMANLRDGGYVVIGIDDADPAAMLPGLSREELESWRSFDDVSSRLARYCDPPVGFQLATLTLSSAAEVAVIHIQEFAEIPHLCAREYEGVLRNGALYVRSRRMPETAEVASSVEMRELLDLATEKRLRAFVETAERAGLRLSAPHDAGHDSTADDAERFEAQLGGAWDERADG